MMNSGEFQERTERIERLVQRANELTDENSRAVALELLESLMDLNGAVTARMVELLSDSGEAGRNLLSKLGNDPLVCGFLVLYGLHPLSLQQRIVAAIERFQPQLRKHGGGNLTVIAATEGQVRVKVQGASTNGSASTLKQKVEQALREAAPEVAEIAIDGLNSADFVPLHMLHPAQQEKRYEESTA
jgi:Fe-S cluster biogenesis protein NfuA